MGLYMYLKAQQTIEGGLPVTLNDVIKIDEVSINMGYWRKANQIHGWFVHHVQKDIDNCATYWVEKKQLKKLKKVCQLVIQNRFLAEKLLPHVQGFYFGESNFDETYFNQILDTINVINNCLSLTDNWEFYYQSSW